MRKAFAFLVLGACLTFGQQQLTVQQRVDDFSYLAGIIHRNSAAIAWKKQALGFDARDLAPWLERVRAAKDDLEYYDILIDYTAAFQDYYTYVTLPSDFGAWMPLSADVYDGKAIVESIDRNLLPASRYNVAIGDEIVSVDGKPAAELMEKFGKYFIDSNPDATRRAGAEMLTYRLQSFMPGAAAIGETAAVVLKKANGDTVTVEIPWQTYGTALRVGPVPDLLSSTATAAAASAGAGRSPRHPRPERIAAEAPLHERVVSEIDSSVRRRAGRLAATQLNPAAQVESALPGIENVGAFEPLYALPEGFVQRRGTSLVDWFYSGSYTAGGKRIGLIRLSAWSTSTTFTSQLDSEIAWMNANTDVLVIDQMRDELTSICGAEAAAARFIGKTYRQPGLEFRATWTNVLTFQSTLDSAIDSGASSDQIAKFQALVDDLRSTYYNGGGNAAPLAFCGTSFDRNPARSSTGAIVNYEKPILLLTDELSSDYFAATVKDNREFPVQQFGMPTSGRMGVNISGPGGAFTETIVHVKDGVWLRPKAAARPGFPETAYIENAGVYPEIVNNFMTLDNFRTQGAAFVEAFTKAAVDLVQ